MKLTQSLEDYLEAIWAIGLKKKVIRVKDLMEYFGYKVSSVNYALNALAFKKLIEHEKYGYVELTEQGILFAQKIYEKRRNITKFLLRFLGIKEEIALEDACNIEHYLHEETYQHLILFAEYISRNDIEERFIRGFHDFLKMRNDIEKGKRNDSII